ncbi:MAG: transporter substrate-binding domain-containing protein [Oscillospiraceae bacterium]|nr:transporter substrate-binding domain-containing protein [Oscillospiraceae bacterium]MBR2928465.1 transporter substrate-binding domain-containing protein [Oscillospiraceae bacterium]MBR6678668.1 transporter substrate-binding domain-containing protein [Oscillospiraceae bacterium]
MMKKMLAMILALVMSLSLVACGGGEDAPADDGADAPEVEEAVLKTVTDGVLTVATSPDFAPYEFYAIDANGEPQLAGFDMALAQYIADYLGLTLEVVPMDFDGTIMELGNKNVDLALAGYSPDPEREDLMDFSDVYITGGQSFVCTQTNKDQFPDLAAANNPDYSIGAQIGSIQAGLAQEHTPDADIIEMSKVTDLVAELVSGKMDGAFIETMVAESYAKSYPELCIALEVPYDAEGSVVGVSKGNAELLAGVNEAIAAALADGSMAKFVEEANELANGEIIEGLVD